jgi:hypothetical protein
MKAITAAGCLAKSIPSLLLLTVAVAHAWRVAVQDLTPWKGGGFGMFSTVDSCGGRPLEVVATVGGIAHLVRFSRADEGLLRLVVTLPSKDHLHFLVATAESRLWRVHSLSPPSISRWTPSSQCEAVIPDHWQASVSALRYRMTSRLLYTEQIAYLARKANTTPEGVVEETGFPIEYVHHIWAQAQTKH